jgi:uncharacterized repeat protein (TIGR01451 family)
MRLILALFLLLTPGLARASDNVALNSEVFVEKLIHGENGASKVILEAPKIVTPGDRLVFVLRYRNIGTVPATNFMVTNPLPSAVAFQGTPDPVAQVSVDGGHNWGAIGALKIRESDGNWRGARPEDVTHVRWPVKQTVPVGAQGKLSFRGIVR